MFHLRLRRIHWIIEDSILRNFPLYQFSTNPPLVPEQFPINVHQRPHKWNKLFESQSLLLFEDMQNVCNCLDVWCEVYSLTIGWCQNGVFVFLQALENYANSDGLVEIHRVIRSIRKPKVSPFWAKIPAAEVLGDPRSENLSAPWTPLWVMVNHRRSSKYSHDPNRWMGASALWRAQSRLMLLVDPDVIYIPLLAVLQASSTILVCSFFSAFRNHPQYEWVINHVCIYIYIPW